MMKLSVCVVLCIIFPIYSMDNVSSERYKKEKECERSLASHIVSMNGTKVAIQDVLKHKIASMRTVNVQSCCHHGSTRHKHCNKHSGNDILLLPDSRGYIEMFCDHVEIHRNGKSKIARMPHTDRPCYDRKEDDYIRACAFNADGSQLATVGGLFLCTWYTSENYCTLNFSQDISQLIQKVVLVNHVALSDSGNRVAVNVVLEKGEESRILVMNRWKTLLWTLKGNNDSFFYLLGENILANRLDKHCYQYDLDIADEPWRALEEEQKNFLYDIYQRYEETKQKVCLKLASDWLSIYQALSQNIHIKTWLDERVYVEAKGWVTKMLGY